MIKQILFDGKVEVGISEIDDGNMRFFGDDDERKIIENQKKLGKMIVLDNVARIRTVYDGRDCFTEFAEIVKDNLSEYSTENSEKIIPVSDGLITKEKEVGMLLPLADCLGAVVFDEKQKIVGLLHAGRQNVEQNGPKKFIEYFVNNFGGNAPDLKIYFSPYALNYRIFKLDKNLGEAVKEQFADAGVLLDNIIDPKIDTVSSDNFPSYSSGDTDRRFAIIVKQV
ncbi:polyphenol oxidase family protein [Candidatus Saccharibacteria bacterium]|nr:polyphenol oxidase family protein [Candidatus Saccharibacteria bacterium]